MLVKKKNVFSSVLHFKRSINQTSSIYSAKRKSKHFSTLEMNTVSSVLEAAACIFSRGSKLRLEFKGGLYLRAASNTNWPKIGPKLGQK